MAADARPQASGEAALGRALLRFAAALALWTAGAAVIAAVNVVKGFEGNVIVVGTSTFDPTLPLAAAFGLGLAAAALHASGAVMVWEIGTAERTRRTQGLSYARVLVVLLFALVAGTAFWALDFKVVAIYAVGVGFFAAAANLGPTLRLMSPLGRRLALTGGLVVLLHYAWLVLFGFLGPIVTATGYALLTAGAFDAKAGAIGAPVEPQESPTE